MKYKFFVIAMACFALIFTNCGKQEPLSPDLEALSEETSLSKVPAEKFIPWEGLQKDFEPISDGDVWYSDGIQHVRGKSSLELLETDNDSLTGYLTITYNYSLNLTTGDGTMSGKWSLDPDAYEGTWEGSSAIKFNNFVLSGRGVGQGKGEFQGCTISVEFHETFPPYNPIPESGYIIIKN